jgi:putative membrane protein
MSGNNENLRTFRNKIALRPAIWVIAAVAFWVGTGLFAPAVAHAHGAIDAGQDPLTVWNTNPLPSLLLLLTAYLYVTGLSRWRRPSHPVNQWQKVSFFAGLLVIFLALQSPIEPLAVHMFSVHQLQHVMLRMLGPVLILLGAPLTPMLRGLPSWALLGVVRPIVGNTEVRRAYDFITNPVLTTLLFLSVLYLWQIPQPHDLALGNDLVHEFMHTTMLFSGFLFWWLVIDPKPHRSRLHYGLRVLYLGLIVIPNTVLGAAITFQSGMIYSGYAQVTQPYNLSLIFDQQIGGLTLWVVGDMMSILVAGIVMIMWYEKEEGGARVFGPA